MTQKFEYKPENVVIVPSAAVKDSGYNPKDERPKDFERVKRSVELNGFMQPVIVRSDPDNKKGYILVDGHQRFHASQELGYSEVPIYTLGDVTEERAKALTVWFQEAKTEFNEIDLSHLVLEVSNAEIELPYTEAQILDFKNMAEFNFDDYDAERPEDNDGELEFETFKVSLGKEAYAIVMQAINEIKEDNDCNDARALELMSADFLNSPAGTTGLGQ